MVGPLSRHAVLLALLLTSSVGSLGLATAWPKLRYDAIVIHHTASDHGDYCTVRRSHHARGWWEIAYHAVISNGSTGVPFGHLYPTYRYRLGLWSVATRSPRFNVKALHLCVVGNFEQSAPSAAMKSALGHALSQLLDRHAIDRNRIFLHRDCSPTACPGQFIERDDVVGWLDLAERAPPGIRAQQSAALSRPLWSAGLLWFAVTGAIGILWIGRKRATHRVARGVSRA